MPSANCVLVEVLSPGCRTSQLLIDDWSSGEVFKSDKTLMLGFYQELITSQNSMYSNGKADINTRIKYLNLNICIYIHTILVLDALSHR